MGIGDSLASVMAATEKEQYKRDVDRAHEAGFNVGGGVKDIIAMWDNYIRSIVHQGGVRSEDELRKITLFDFMNWLRGQNV